MGTLDATPSGFGNANRKGPALNSSAYKGLPSMKVYPCAKTSCRNKGTITCMRCALVAYCSASCKKEAQSEHNASCNSPLAKKTWKPSWEAERRQPHWMSGGGIGLPMDIRGPIAYLWGNIPAIDVLKLNKAEYDLLWQPPNEGRVALCFAASGDVRNVIMTLCGIADSGRIAHMQIATNDRNPYVTIRNLAILLLLCHFPGPTAAELVIHLSYSIMLMDAQHEAIQTTLLAYLDKVKFRTAKGPKKRVFHHEFEFDRGIKLLASLTIAEWYLFDRILRFTLEKKTAKDRYHHILLGRPDHIDRFLLPLMPYERVALKAYRNFGLFLPHAKATSHNNGYSTTNPFLFDPNTTHWMMPDSLTPDQGWDIRKALEFGTKLGIPMNDLYGNLYFYVRDIIIRASENLHNLQACSIRFTCVEATALPSALALMPTVNNMDRPEWALTEFDRIEVSNICDEQYLGIRTVLSTFGPLLRDINPEATLLTMFINAPQAEVILNGPSMENMWRAGHDVLQVFRDPRSPHMSVATMARVAEVAKDLTNYPAAFSRHLWHYRFRNAAIRAHLKLRKGQRIMPQWPYLLILHALGQNLTTQLHFLDLSSLSGAECYLEWIRGDGQGVLDPESWSKMWLVLLAGGLGFFLWLLPTWWVLFACVGFLVWLFWSPVVLVASVGFVAWKLGYWWVLWACVVCLPLVLRNRWILMACIGLCMWLLGNGWNPACIHGDC